MTHHNWSAADAPDQTGRVAVVTGANSGLGFQAALLLARLGATVVLACRDPAKAAGAADRIHAAVPEAKTETLTLDLASLRSIRAAAGDVGEADLLINNAGGVRMRRELTEDGLESTFATNHLGPFAFTGLLLDRLLAKENSRVVTVTSIAHRRATMRFGDLQFEHGYRSQAAYAQAKLANLLFTAELQRRLAGTSTLAVAAHPGNARTGFSRDMNPVARVILGPVAKPLTFWFLQDAPVAALSLVRAATDPAARGGSLYGPSGFGQFTGAPAEVAPAPVAQDAEAARKLWQESERLTGVHYRSTGVGA